MDFILTRFGWGRFLVVFWIAVIASIVGASELNDADDNVAAAPFEIHVGSAAPIADGWDAQSGYMFWCPCMGNFGNQVDQYLGALIAAKMSNRTVVLPPFVVYYHDAPVQTPPTMEPFDTFFKVDAVSEYHRAITMETFMRRFGKTRWPPGSRLGYCVQYFDAERKCGFDIGVPFTSFWAHFGIKFDEVSEMFGPGSERAPWWDRLTPADHPVIAMRDAMGHYPILAENRHMQRYLVWSDLIASQGRDAIGALGIVGPLVTVHLRNGNDWVRACVRVEGRRSFMSSPQCDHLRASPSKLMTANECLPSADHVASRVVKAVKQSRAKTVFVGTDEDAMVEHIVGALRESGVYAEMGGVSVITLGSNAELASRVRFRPQVELWILSQGDIFVGNCVSSFSAFVARERQLAGKPTAYFGVPWPK